MFFPNTPSDLQSVPPDVELGAFLSALLNDYIAYDDAAYPENYNHSLKESDEEFIEPVIRREWNAAAAAAWGFSSREAIESQIQQL
jgi:hypothetical protein